VEIKSNPKNEDKLIIVRWGDPPTQELANTSIKDEDISKATLDDLKIVIEARRNLIKKLLNNE